MNFRPPVFHLETLVVIIVEVLIINHMETNQHTLRVLIVNQNIYH